MELPDLSQALKYIKSFQAPIKLSKTTCAIGALFPQTALLSAQLTKRVVLVSGPLNGVAVLVEGFALAQITDAAKAVQKGLSLVKKGCEITLWAEWCGLILVEDSTKHTFKGISACINMAKATNRLWKDLGADPDQRKLSVSIPKFLTASLLVVVHLTDNHRVRVYIKLAVKGFEALQFSYSLYQQSQKITFHQIEWTCVKAKAYQVITSIAVTGIAVYIIERNVNFDALR